MDAVDRAILRALQRNGRISIQELSRDVGLSPTPCARRVRQLEEKGVIRGYSALLDDAALGFGVTVFVSVRLERQTDLELRRFEAAISAFPEVVECWLMTGPRDYLLRVSVEDLGAFEAFLTRRLTAAPGVAAIDSAVPLRCVKAALGRVV